MKNMKAQIKLTITLITVLFFGIALPTAHAQSTYQTNVAKVTIKGTSSLHDWDMTSTKGQIKAAFEISNGQVTGINTLKFSLAAESLQSSKKGLDKNAYKALSTNKHKEITFSMTSGKVTDEGNNNFKVTATGNLTIAGTTKATTIVAIGQFKANTITIKGSTKLTMTTYKVVPPTVMLGTIKTGDGLTIEYQATLTP